MKKSELKQMIMEVLEEENNGYEEFFNSALKKFGAKSPDRLYGKKKKDFFDYVDKNWTKNETLEPVSPAQGNPTKRVKAKKRDQILAQEIRRMVKEELRFVMFNEIPNGISRKRAKKRIRMSGNAEDLL